MRNCFDQINVGGNIPEYQDQFVETEKCPRKFQMSEQLIPCNYELYAYYTLEYTYDVGTLMPSVGDIVCFIKKWQSLRAQKPRSFVMSSRLLTIEIHFSAKLSRTMTFAKKF